MKMNEEFANALSAAPQPIRLHLNGAWVRHDAAPRTHLGDFVRDHCGLTGTHLGCEHGVCGACTVLVDDQPVRSCITFAIACDQKDVRTIEGYGDDPWMEKLRAAFSREHALQCGYCTPGMLATAYDIVRRLPEADEERIRVELSGNLCRCTGYVGIVRAIMSVLAGLKAEPIAAESSPAAPVAAVKAAAPMRSFTVAKEAAATAAPAPTPATVSATESRKGWSHIEDSFTVDFPAQQVWDFTGDVEALASCLPGAEVLENDGRSVKGRIAIKFGPIAAAFNGSAVLERDDAGRSGMLRGAGTDSISQSRAKGDVGYRIVAIDEGRTRVDITLDHMLQGALAQFSRSGLVRDFVTRMIADFGRNLSACMGGADAADMPARSLSVSGTMLSIIWARLKRLFGHR
ncbi:MAG: carbon monoxide dehydrogenase [Burkholderia sp.]|nr:carbon monoxide dehydrogenase [Burkholderia sp.]